MFTTPFKFDRRSFYFEGYPTPKALDVFQKKIEEVNEKLINVREDEYISVKGKMELSAELMRERKYLLRCINRLKKASPDDIWDYCLPWWVDSMLQKR